MSDLVERLREAAMSLRSPERKSCDEAATEIEQLSEEITTLRFVIREIIRTAARPDLTAPTALGMVVRIARGAVKEI